MWELSLSPKNSFQIHKIFLFFFYLCRIGTKAGDAILATMDFGRIDGGRRPVTGMMSGPRTNQIWRSIGRRSDERVKKNQQLLFFVRVHTEINNNNERNCVVIVRQSVGETTEFCFSFLFRVYETCRLNGSPWHTEPWAGRKSESGYIRRRRWWWERSGGYPVGGGGGREEGRDTHTHTHLADWPTLTVSVCSRRSCCAENNNMWSSGVPPLHGVV